MSRRNAARKKASSSGATARAADWSAGDRIGKVTVPVLREMVLRLMLGHEVDRDALGEVVELADIILSTTIEVSDESTLTLNEVADQVRSLEEKRVEAEEDQNERVKELEEKYDDLESRCAGADKDHAIDIAEHCKIIDDLRRRTERAEHDLAETVKAGHERDQEMRKSDINDRVRLEKRVEDLEKALEHARATAPIKVRKR